MKRTLKEELFSIIRRAGRALETDEILTSLETSYPDALIPAVVQELRHLQDEKKLIATGRSWRVAPQVELNASEVHGFLSNAQIALAGAKIQEGRLNYLASYSNSLEESLLKYSQLSEDEIAFVLVSTAYNVKFPEGRP
jgi:hypothetical protein